MASRKTTQRKSGSNLAAAPIVDIGDAILMLRGQRVLLDSDLAALYGVETKVLLQSVRRNMERFPADFMMQLTQEEWDSLRTQFATPNDHLRSQIVTSRLTHGGRRYAPYVFTEQGVAMLSSVLNSKHAIAVNIEIMRTFVQLRSLLASNNEIAHQLKKLERKVGSHDQTIAGILNAIRELMHPPEPKKRSIGFTELQETKKS